MQEDSAGTSVVWWWGEQGAGEGGHLQVGGHQLEDVVDLVLEPARQHLIGLIQHEHLDPERPATRTHQQLQVSSHKPHRTLPT